GLRGGPRHALRERRDRTGEEPDGRGHARVPCFPSGHSGIMRDPALPRKFASPGAERQVAPEEVNLPMDKTIVVIPGDGIGPEIMQATLRVLDALDIGIRYEFAEAGVAAREKG